MYRKKKVAVGNLSDRFYRMALSLVFVVAAGHALGQAPKISYATPQTYSVNTTIVPLSPNNSGGVVPVTAGTPSVFAGSGATGAANGPSETASFHYPYGTVCDAANNVYVADYDNNQIRVITPAGVVSTFAGTGRTGLADGPAATATFFEPTSLAFDAVGNLFVCDMNNSLIRKITPAGIVSTLAGTGHESYADGTGTQAGFSGPTGIATDFAGNVYVADKNNDRIRKITPAGVVTTIAGNGTRASIDGTGTGASFDLPQSLTIDGTGNIYVVDYVGNKVRKIDPAGVVTTIAGSGEAASVDGLGAAAQFNRPIGIVINKAGYLFVTEYDSNSVRMVSPAGMVSTLPGVYSTPTGPSLDAFGNLYVVNNISNMIYKTITSGYYIDKPLPAGLIFDPTKGIITGTPTTRSPLTDYTVTAYNGYGTSSTVVKIEVLSVNTLLPSVITFPGFDNKEIVDNEIDPGAYSTNKETPITYTSDNPAVATIAPDGLLYITGPGTAMITGHQAGNANYSEAKPVTVPIVITISQKIDFADIPAKQVCSADFQAGALPHDYGFKLSSVPVTYSSSNTAVATVSATGLVHIVGKGTTIITANQAATTYYTAAKPVLQTLTVTGPAVPDVALIASNYTACDGTSLTFTAKVANLSALVNPSYQWQLNGVNVGTNADTFDAILARTDQLQCIVTNNDGCTAQSAPRLITGEILGSLTSLTVKIVSSQTSPVCVGELIKFTAMAGIGPGTDSYQWKVNGINAGTNSPEFSSTTFADGDVITCAITNTGALCLVAPTVTSNSLTATVTPPANPAPSVTIAASDNKVYVGTTITFTATPANTTGVVTYQWKLNGADAGTNGPTFTSAKFANGDKVTCTILNRSCNPPAVSEQLTLTILPPLTITPPNTFTPNNDGVNDLWDISGLSAFQNSTLNIYSRYGELLYHSKGYNIPWDGVYKGQNLPAATYYYVIDLGNGKLPISGYVVIVR